MELPKRKKNRLKGYDYSQKGAYFITICTKDRRKTLWDCDNVGAHSVRQELSQIGKTVEKSIENISRVYENATVDKYIIMPNHVHCIIVLEDVDTVGNGRTVCAPTVSRIIKQYKEFVTIEIGFPIWQKSFHDHIIRNEEEYYKIWEYIHTNPLNWETDCYFSSV